LVKFSDQVDELADKAESILQEITAEAPVAAAEATPTATVSTAGTGNDGAISFLEAFRDLESAAREASEASGAASPLLIPTLKALSHQGLIPADAVSVGEQLRSIRNRVIHGIQPLTSEDVEGLVTAARSLATACRAATIAVTGSQNG